MKEIFAYVIGLGAAVMMPVIFTVLGVCIGIKPAKALKSGLLVGVGFVGLGVVTALLTSNLGPALKGMTELYHLNLPYFDLGWPAAAAVAYSCAVGAFIIPVCLGVNVLMLVVGATRTVNIDLWNYWHFAFLGAMVFFATGSLAWAFYAAIVLYVITLCMADFTAKGFQAYYKDMDGISIPQPFCQSFTPFAVAIGWLLDRIPGFSKLDIDAEGMKKKFGLLGEPLFLGVVIGCGIGALRCASWKAVVDSIPAILKLGVTVGAVMELIPRITGLFIEGLKPICDGVRSRLESRLVKATADGQSSNPTIRQSNLLHRNEPGARHRTSHHACRIDPAHPGDSVPLRLSAGQQVPAARVARRGVLSLPVRPADHEGERAEDVHRRAGGAGRGAFLCHEPDAGVHEGHRGGELRRHCGAVRLRGRRGAGLRLGALVLADLPSDGVAQMDRCDRRRGFRARPVRREFRSHP